MKAERFVVVASALITFLLASAGVAAVYWTAGGTFERGIGLATYLLVEVYLGLVVLNIAKQRPRVRPQPEEANDPGRVE